LNREADGNTMLPHSTQTFFLPDEYASQTSTMAADCYNLVHTLLNRSDTGHVFIPIRSMQYLAILDGSDIWFVDSQAYAVSDNQGGRLITISWHSDKPTQSLQENIVMQVVFHAPDMQAVQQRLIGEFRKAIRLIDQRYRDSNIPGEGAVILPLQH
jgi:hypothetical protein